jgi:hypothetical protein
MSVLRRLVALPAALLAVQVASAQTAPQASAVVTVGGEPIEIPLRWDAEEKGWVVASETGSWLYEDNEARISVSLNMDPDPSIAYGLSVVDIGLPSMFGFIFSTPIVPTGTPNVVSASIVGGMTDFAGDGVSLTPVAPLLQTASVGAPSTVMGVDVGAGASALPGTAGSFYAYGPHAAGPIAGPGPGPWTSLTTTTLFTGSGGGDVYALTGFASIELVPEPAMLSLVLLAAPLAMGRRFRGRRA